MGATGTDHHKPKNIEQWPWRSYITEDREHMIVQHGTGPAWALYRRVGTFTTRRSAATFAELATTEAPIEMDREPEES